MDQCQVRGGTSPSLSQVDLILNDGSNAGGYHATNIHQPAVFFVELDRYRPANEAGLARLQIGILPLNAGQRDPLDVSYDLPLSNDFSAIDGSELLKNGPVDGVGQVVGRAVAETEYRLPRVTAVELSKRVNPVLRALRCPGNNPPCAVGRTMNNPQPR